MATDKELADKVIECVLLLGKCVRDAERAGMEVKLNTYSEPYGAKIYRRTDVVIAESPKPKHK